MQSLLVLLLFCLTVLLVSFVGSLFWLSIPLLLQLIVDKVLIQNSTDTLSVLGIALLVSTLIASAVEVGLNSLIAVLARSQMASRETLLQLAAVLPRALVIISVIMIYNLQIGAATTVLTAIACGSYYFLNKTIDSSNPGNYPLPLSFRLPLTLIPLVILWHGVSLVLSDELSLGQWIAIGLLSLQFAACLLSFATVTLGVRRA